MLAAVSLTKMTMLVARFGIQHVSASGDKDPLGEELLVGPAAGPLRDQPGQQETRAAVVPLRARLGTQLRDS
jgi:hypothetical protein